MAAGMAIAVIAAKSIWLSWTKTLKAAVSETRIGNGFIDSGSMFVLFNYFTNIA
jgi:hypothetical protein